MKIIELLKYIFLSVIQGVGEILPISSSGHLILFRKILNINTEGFAVELILHVASLVALFIYYRKLIFRLIKGFFKYLFIKDKSFFKEYKFTIGMVISLIPTCLVGYFANDYLDYFLKYTFVVGIFLIFNGINLLAIKNKKGDKKIEDLSYFSFVKIGLGQCLGLLPGFSRSGSCLSMCYRENLNKEDSERFTFLMLFPLVIGSILINLNDFVFQKDLFILLIISFIVTFMVTYFCLGLLTKIVSKGKIHYFFYYCIIIGIIIVLGI